MPSIAGSPFTSQRSAPPAAPGGSLEGVVRVAAGGPVPGPTRIENTTDPVICGRSHRLEDLIVHPDTRGVAHAIAVVEGAGVERAAAADRPGRLILDNRNCRFVPHTAVATAGTVLEMINSDPTLHTVHLYGPMDVNIALPLEGMRARRRLDQPGLIIVKCDVHGWMQAYVRVDRHPFHAVTDASGAFRISRIPAGEYTLVVWHEKLGERRHPLSVAAGRPVRVEITYVVPAGS